MFQAGAWNRTLPRLALFKAAFRLLGVRKSETFYRAARELGVAA